MKSSINALLVTITFLSIVIFSNNSMAQDDKSKRPSPPAEVSAKVKKTEITINYSQTSVKYRKIWGGLVPYDKVWRTGANEATTFEVSTDVKIEGEILPAGKYSLFTIPGETDWTVIFNNVSDQWGAYSYDPSKDALRVQVVPNKYDEMTEMLTFKIAKDGWVTMMWEKLGIGFSVKGQK